MRTCTVQSYDRPHKAKGYCTAHHYRVQRHGDPLEDVPFGTAKLESPTPCTVVLCDRMAFARGMCKAHYSRFRRGHVTPDVPIGEPVAEPPVVTTGDAVECSIDGCERPSEARGWCHAHYMRWFETGDVRADEPLRQTERAICRVEGCGRPVTGRGLCRRHYQAWKRGPYDEVPD